MAYYTLLWWLCYTTTVIMRTHMSQKYTSVTRKGFALPSVLIASIVMLTVLTVAVSTTAAIRTDLMTQYYTQLAQAAGEAGVAQAVACLQANNDVPTWSNSSPLTPQTNCSGTVVSGYPTYLVNANNVQSTYSVSLPATDNQGYATTIPSVGSVQLLRSSTGAVWKTYSATVARSATPASTCSSGASAAQGWTNASVTSYTSAQSVPNALPISPSSTANLNPGPVYYRKDFNITTAGTYSIAMTADDHGVAYIDGSQVLTSGTNGAGATETGTVTLSAGCHTITINAVNAGFTPNPVYISFTLAKGSSAPIVSSDTSWLVTVGGTVHYSSLSYYADVNDDLWNPVLDLGWWDSSGVQSTSISGWASTSGDNFTDWITTNTSNSGGTYPAPDWTYYRNPNGFYLSASTSVKVSTACDDSCAVYMDGTQLYLDANSWTTPYVYTGTLAAGWHTFGVAVYNGGSSANPSGFLFDAVRTSDGAVLMRSDSTWQSMNKWESNRNNYYTYSASYAPTPSQTKGIASVSALVVAGGGGGGSNAGGGGGGGGVVYNSSYNVSTTTYTVTVGGGGAGSTTANIVGTKGSNSVFGTLTALGGGGGAPRDTAGSVPTSGGSGGGGSGGYTGNSYIGASGTVGQGNNGGNGTAPDAGCNAAGGGGGGGGGIGGVGTTSMAGAGGSGFISYLTGVLMIYGAGGAGSTTCAGPTKGVADTGGGAGTGANGTTNLGGGGGGQVGSNVAGAGGSGIVIISFPTGSITASATGAYTTSIFGTNTIYKFTGNGTFTVSSINI